MTRRNWIIVLIAAGVGLAILIGVLGTRNEPSSSQSKTQAVNSLCNSLAAFGSSVETLLKSSSTSDFQTNAQTVQSSWDQVTADYQAVQNAPSGQLESAWNNFTASIKNADSASSASAAVSDISQSANALVSAAQATQSQLSCT